MYILLRCIYKYLHKNTCNQIHILEKKNPKIIFCIQNSKLFVFCLCCRFWRNEKKNEVTSNFIYKHLARACKY